MPRKDLQHEDVKIALEKEGWMITDDPLDLSMGAGRFIGRFGCREMDRSRNERHKNCRRN